ncbi:MAG: Hsp20/alpha crystallin family protein [Bacteriovorax sp.]|jgi:HSP20 family protein
MSLLSKSSRNLPVKSSPGSYDVFKYFDDFFNRSGADFYDSSASAFSPSVNIEETKDSYRVEAEIPGVQKKDVEVSVKDDYLVIKGEKKSFSEEKRDQYHRVERSHGSFYRTIALPGDIDKDKINAELKDGVLNIEIMKSESKKEEAQKSIPIH